MHKRIRVKPCSARQLLDDVLREFDLHRFWTDEAAPERSGSQNDEADPLQVVSVVRVIASRYQDAYAFLREWDRLAAEEEQHADIADDDLAREAEEDRVVIGTIHAAKGREYRSVVSADYYRSLTSVLNEEREEERRVLYVGVTRAQDSVLLTVDLSKPEVHPFICELISPPTRGEAQQIQMQMKKLAAEETQHVAVLERGEDDTRTAHNSSIDELEWNLAHTRRREMDLTMEIGKLQESLDTTRLRNIARLLLGQFPSMQQQLEDLARQREAVRASIEELKAKIAYIQVHHRDTTSRPEVKTKELKQRLVEIRDAKVQLNRRLTELSLVDDGQ
jgi:superfamily I DNA/RNA helicase